MFWKCISEHNPELLYNVLHQRVNLVKLRGKAGLAEYIDNIELVNGFFSGHLKLNSDDQGQGPILNMEEIQKVISSSVRQLPIGKLRTFPVMKYQYEGTFHFQLFVGNQIEAKSDFSEDQEPDEFFVPYCWSIILDSAPHIGWDVANVRLFSIDSYV